MHQIYANFIIKLVFESIINAPPRVHVGFTQQHVRFIEFYSNEYAIVYQNQDHI